MYNRYQGNSGRVERVPDAPQPEIRPRPPAPSGGNNKPPPGLTGGGLQQLLQKFSLADLESEDLLLILVLYLMYRAARAAARRGGNDSKWPARCAGRPCRRRRD